jgi:hypothetical protein
MHQSFRLVLRSGLPDGLFSNQKSQFGYFVRSCYGNLGIFYDHLVYFTAIFYGHLVYFVVTWYIFTRFGILDHEKSGNPGYDPCSKKGNR